MSRPIVRSIPINIVQRIPFFCMVVAITMLVSVSAAHAGKRANPKVVTSQAKSGTVIKEIRLSGTVTSPSVSRLSAEVSGLVKNMHVDAGMQVKSGDLLMMMDTERVDLSLQAAVATALAAKEELADAKRRLADGQRLAKKKTLSASDLRSLEAEVNIAHATLQRYTAEKQLQQARVKRHQLRAPFSGVISQKFVEVGEWLQPGNAVVELVANEGLRVDFQVPQQVFPKIKLSSEIFINVDAMPGQTIPGVIQAIVPYSDSDARTFLLRVSLPESNPAVVPGMSASGLLRLDTASDGIIVPRDAVLRYPDGRITVWVVSMKDTNYIATERQIKTGLSFNGNISILEGLNIDEQVVVQGNESLKDGQTVTLKNP